MNRATLWLVVVSGTVVLCGPATTRAADNPAVGRWDITIHDTAQGTPSWLEVTAEGSATKARFCGPVGGVCEPQGLTLTGKEIAFKTKNYTERARTRNAGPGPGGSPATR